MRVGRIIPDCVRAACANQPIVVRNPHSVRPYQHVMEPLTACSTIAQMQAENPVLASGYNVSPDDADCVNTGTLAQMFVTAWGNPRVGKPREFQRTPHEAGFLKLDTSKIRQKLGWLPTWNIKTAIEETVA